MYTCPCACLYPCLDTCLCTPAPQQVPPLQQLRLLRQPCVPPERGSKKNMNGRAVGCPWLDATKRPPSRRDLADATLGSLFATLALAVGGLGDACAKGSAFSGEDRAAITKRRAQLWWRFFGWCGLGPTGLHACVHACVRACVHCGWAAAPF